VRFLLALFAPLRFLLRLIFRPLIRRSRRKALSKDGWLELHLDGEIREVRHPSRLPPIVKKWLRREDPPQVVLSRLRRFADDAALDPLVKGVLVRVDLLGGGFASAAAIRAELDKLRDAGKQLFVHIASHAGNKEMLIATAATRLAMTPSGALAAVGASSIGLFLKDTLDRFGVKVEVAAKGRYKSAPEQMTRTDRSAFDREQTQALIDRADTALLDAIVRGRGFTAERTKALIDRSPMIGILAEKEGYCDELARDEDLPERVQTYASLPKPPDLIGAGRYLDWGDRLRPRKKRKQKLVGVVEAHGAIVEQASTYGSYVDRLAVQKNVVNDLRAALEEPEIGAVILHVDSRGGSVTASDAIYAAVQRLDREKPVIACFGDVSASGGYYIACGARAIVCSPMTITGSIGVFAMYPTWPELGERFAVHHDVVKNFKNAALYNPWTRMPEETRAHAEGEVDAMYETFIELVAKARNKTRDEIHAVAEGRVWAGTDAHRVGLIDGLGGMTEAVERAKAAARDVSFGEDLLYVRAKESMDRPSPPEKEEAANAFLEHASLLLQGRGEQAVLRELYALLRQPRSFFAYAPIVIS
jgi:protease-4